MNEQPPPVCPYCGLQTPSAAQHMLERHGITPRQHETNLANAYGAALEDIPEWHDSRLPRGGYL